ncbi:hypothetical protein ACH5RR_026521 [Cinchona calisaya]|uniref:KIB1-4 beta-propeller domain-containing protein n=1 Tax=Cinchona calisaya TaxID=153742 RepID=A0ABD2Z4W4_9GENT
MEEDQGDHEVIYYSFPPIYNQTCPWLLIFQGEHFEKHIFYSVDENRYYSRTIPEMRRKYLLASSHGWLLLADCFKDDCFLLNPQSKEKIQLPLLKSKYQLEERTVIVDYRKAKFVFSKPPTDPECHILLICDLGRLLLFCKLGDEKFTVQSATFGNDHISTALVFQGKVYALLKPSYKIATIDFNAADSAIEVQPLIKDGRPCAVPRRPSVLSSQHFEEYLVESFDELLCIRKIYSAFFAKEVSDFEIFRVDLCNMECEVLDALGERTIFLSNGMSYSTIAAISRTVRNSVYYTETGEKNLFLYELEDRSKTILQACPNEGSDWLGQCWVLMH